MKREKKDIIVCSHCGSSDVHVKAWVNATTNKWVSDAGDGEFYCASCKEHCIEITTRETWERNNPMFVNCTPKAVRAAKKTIEEQEGINNAATSNKEIIKMNRKDLSDWFFEMEDPDSEEGKLFTLDGEYGTFKVDYFYMHCCYAEYKIDEDEMLDKLRLW